MFACILYTAQHLQFCMLFLALNSCLSIYLSFTAFLSTLSDRSAHWPRSARRRECNANEKSNENVCAPAAAVFTAAATATAATTTAATTTIAIAATTVAPMAWAAAVVVAAVAALGCRNHKVSHPLCTMAIRSNITSSTSINSNSSSTSRVTYLPHTHRRSHFNTNRSSALCNHTRRPSTIRIKSCTRSRTPFRAVLSTRHTPARCRRGTAAIGRSMTAAAAATVARAAPTMVFSTRTPRHAIWTTSRTLPVAAAGAAAAAGAMRIVMDTLAVAALSRRSFPAPMAATLATAATSIPTTLPMTPLTLRRARLRLRLRLPCLALPTSVRTRTARRRMRCAPRHSPTAPATAVVTATAALAVRSVPMAMAAAAARRQRPCLRCPRPRLQAHRHRHRPRLRRPRWCRLRNRRRRRPCPNPSR
jgi:hypothetical protein